MELFQATGKDLTVEDLRKLKGCENLSDEDAEKAVKSIKEYSLLVCSAVERMFKCKSYIIDNQYNMTIFASNKAA